MATIILPQRVPLTDGQGYITKEWSRALQDLTNGASVTYTTNTTTGTTYSNFSGDSGAGGAAGLVPAPAPGDGALNRYLKADGTWTTPSTTSAATSTDDASLTIAMQAMAKRAAAATVATAATPSDTLSDVLATRVFGD